MSLPLLHSPADILRWLLIDLGEGSDPTLVPVTATPPANSWPAYEGGAPGTPDDILTCFNTTSKPAMRTMIDGEFSKFHGFQIQVRSAEQPTGATKAHRLKQILTENVYQNSVIVTSGGQTATYIMYNISDVHVEALGKLVPQSKHTIHTLSGYLTIGRIL